MGEIAQMMLEGVLCERCGVALLDEGEEVPGFPCLCEDCKEEDLDEHMNEMSAVVMREAMEDDERYKIK